MKLLSIAKGVKINIKAIPGTAIGTLIDLRENSKIKKNKELIL
jgi:hypothetical protein